VRVSKAQGERIPTFKQGAENHCRSVNALQADLLHLVHGDSVPEDQLHAFLGWYSNSAADRPETRPAPRTRKGSHDAATRHDDNVGDDDDADINKSASHHHNQQHQQQQQPQRRGLKLTTGNDDARSPPTSDLSVDTPGAATPNRSYIHVINVFIRATLCYGPVSVCLSVSVTSRSYTGCTDRAGFWRGSFSFLQRILHCVVSKFG